MVKYSVLFVCTGNICRSPTAEGVFRHYVEENGLSELVQIDSAGTHGYHTGDPPDHRAVSCASARGIKMDDLRARKVANDDFKTFDLILAMDDGHYDILSTRCSQLEGSASVELFMDFAKDPDRSDVPDPYYGGISDFEYALDLVEQGANGLLEHLKKEIGK